MCESQLLYCVCCTQSQEHCFLLKYTVSFLENTVVLGTVLFCKDNEIQATSVLVEDYTTIPSSSTVNLGSN